MTYVNNVLTDLIDGIEQMGRNIDTITIPSNGAPFYSSSTSENHHAFGIPGINLSEEELIADAEALGVIMEDRKETVFYHSSQNGVGPVWKMKALVRFLTDTYVIFEYEGVAWGPVK